MAQKKNSGIKSVYEQINIELGKMPPNAVEFEEAVLGACMIEKDAYLNIAEILKPEMFYKENHQKIFKAIHNIAVDSESVDIITVTQELRKNNTLDEIGGPVYLAQLTNKVGSAAHIEIHARIIQQKYVQRELIRISSEIQKKSYDDSEDVKDLLDFAESEIFAIAEGSGSKDSRHIRPIIDEALELIHEAAKRPDGLSGLASGFTELDKITPGWQKSDLIIIAARPAMGKTAFVLSMARNMAVEYDQAVALFSLEMSAVQLVNRLIVAESELAHDKIKNGKLEPYEWEQLDIKLEKLYNAPIFIDDTPALSVFELRAKCRRLKSQNKLDIVIIDYLQLMTGPASSGNREQEVSNISRSLKALAKELNVPIITLSQLNRSVETRSGDKRPQLSDLRESGAIEQDADMVFFIHRPEYYGLTQDADGNDTKGLAELIIAKHRNGATGIVNLKFKPEFAQFTGYDTFNLPEDPGEIRVSSRINEIDDKAMNSGINEFDIPAPPPDDEAPF